MHHHKSELESQAAVQVTEASGMVVIAWSTKRIGIARRSSYVHVGNCWGTIGGTMATGVPPRENAIRELFEETGYRGKIDLHLAYIFSSPGFHYYNYVAVVPDEFLLDPGCKHPWENDELGWFSLTDLCQLLNRQPRSFHFGLHRLMLNAEGMIRQLTLGEYPAVEWFRSHWSGFALSNPRS
jgi:8-oxo-dGTP pyrophosphatase MutT (NUDIX family)